MLVQLRNHSQVATGHHRYLVSLTSCKYAQCRLQQRWQHGCKSSAFASWYKKIHHQHKLQRIKTILGTSGSRMQQPNAGSTREGLVGDSAFVQAAIGCCILLLLVAKMAFIFCNKTTHALPLWQSAYCRAGARGLPRSYLRKTYAACLWKKVSYSCQVPYVRHSQLRTPRSWPQNRICSYFYDQ